VNLEDYRTVFIGTCLVLMLIAASPSLSVVIPLSSGREPFSEIWVLGPTHMLEDYPFNVVIGERQKIFVGVGNDMGRLAYCIVYVKLRNQTQVAPNSTTSTPSSLTPLYEFRAIIADAETWERPVTFSLLEATHLGDLLIITKMMINDVVFSVNYPSVWDKANSGFFYQLFFELWMYDDAVTSFQYQNRFVGIWLNMTI